jgi:integrase
MSRKNYAPAQPRHTLDEMRRLLVASAEGDPRFHALFQLAAEYRLGQAVRAMRSDLELEDAKTFAIQGAGKKKGEIVALTPAQVEVARGYLNGLLAPLEDLYHVGEISDYPLFPSGRLRTKNGVFRLGRTMDPRSKRAEPLIPASREWVIKQFIATERRAKVKHVAGRAAYGVRRINVDEALESGISPRGLMAAGGWSDPKIPTTVYAEKENRAGRREAMRTRMHIRGEKPTPDQPEQTPATDEAGRA